MKCSHSGCGKDFDPVANPDGACIYHSGAPVFHEGLKSWSCCNSTNKPVLDFESFLSLPGCTTGRHSADAPKAEPVRSSGISNFKESAPSTIPSAAVGPPPPAATPISAAPTPLASKPVPYIEDEDDTSVPVPVGMKCLRNGCKKTFVNDELSRRGDGPEAECIYHPAPPLFREGSKGYLCCKRKVLEFDEFLKIEGCKKGRHLFVKKNANNSGTEELVTCRVDHYQTPSQVHASVFAKKADKERSSVVFTEQTVELNIVLPDSKRFVRTIELSGPIKPAASTYTFYGTKIELVLAKQDNRSWNTLERGEQTIAQITFGVSGRTGTVGAKAPVLDEANRVRSGV